MDSSPPFQVHPLAIADSTQVAHNNMTSFWTNPIWRLLWTRKFKPLSHVITQSALRTPHNLLQDRLHRRHQKAIDTCTGELVGYIRWILPDVSGVELMWPEAQVPDVGEGRKMAFLRDHQRADWDYDRLQDGLDPPVTQMKANLMSGHNYLVLDYLAVHPDHWGNGIASLLVERGVREADKLGLECFVMAMKAALGVYRRAGFELVGEVVQDAGPFGGLGDWEQYFLVRRVGKGDGGKGNEDEDVVMVVDEGKDEHGM